VSAPWREAQSQGSNGLVRGNVRALGAPVALAELPPFLLEEGFELLDPGGAKGNNTRPSIEKRLSRGLRCDVCVDLMGRSRSFGGRRGPHRVGRPRLHRPAVRAHSRAT